MSREDVERELEVIKVEGAVSRKRLAELRRAFGSRFSSAWRLVREGRVKKYVFKPTNRVQWIVAGKERDYLIYEHAPFCHCLDFYQAVVDGRAKACKHLIAQRIASQLGLYEVVEESEEKYPVLMEEWRRVEEGE